jgi:hypothetical protein
LLVLSGVYVVAVFMLERRFAWRSLAYPAAGILMGLIFNPYFPENIEFILGHLAPKLGESTTRVGNEWSPYQTLTLLENSAGALMAVLLGALALGWQKERIDLRTLTALGLVAVFGYMLFRSRRFVEYFPAFALVFLALAAAPALNEWRQRWATTGLYRFLLPVGMLLLLIYPLGVTLRDGRALLADSKDAGYFAGAALWMNRNTPAGSTIFQTDWDDFTRLFFYHDDAVYTAGLDPTFMELYDADRFVLWRDITQGDVEQPGRIIRDDFGASYVFTDLDHDDFLAVAAEDPLLEEVYRDEYAAVYSVRGERTDQ